jgi:hypothetical protein
MTALQINTDKLRIFLSHIHEEKALALVVKAELEDAFSHRVEVFVSSDPWTNPGGEEWLAKIRAELAHERLRMLISLMSPVSKERHWILVELGAVWGRNLRVFPLCHSGTRPGDLQRPLQDFHGSPLDDDDAAMRLVRAVEMATGLTAPKGWSRDDFLRKMRAAASRSEPAPPKPKSTDPAPLLSALTPEQEKILRILHHAFNGGMAKKSLTDSDGAKRVGMDPSDFRVNVRALESAGLVGNTIAVGTGYHWHINDAGLKWISDHKQPGAGTAAPSPTNSTATVASRVQPPTHPVDVKLDEYEIDILKLLTEHVGSGTENREGLTLDQGASAMFMKPTFYRLHIATLEEHGLVRREVHLGEGADVFCITDEGLRWLKRGGLL